MSKTRKYTDKTLKRLFALSGNQCAFPDCDRIMVNETNARDSNICHIEAKNKGGERYNQNMTDEERDDYPNLILLCVQHHDETNDEQEYTVERLKKMRQSHEIYISSKLSPQQKLSLLSEVVNKISMLNIDEVKGEEVSNSFNPEDKISYNNIKVYKPILEEYKVYQAKLNTIYKEIESQGSFKKNALLKNIKSIYLRAKGELSYDSQQDIMENSDELIDKVKNALWKLFEETKNPENLIPYENLNFSLEIIIVDAFMRCKILEEPRK